MVVQSLGRVTADLFVLGTVKNPIYLTGHGDEWALIEGGLEWMAPLVLRQVDECLPSRACVRHWLVTHSHYDHCGLIEGLYPHFPGIQVHASAAVAKAFGSARARALVRELNAEVRQLPGFEQGHDLLPFAGGFPPTSIDSIPVRVLADGEIVTLGRHAFRVIGTPGHSRCSTSFFDEGNGRLFVSDALGEITSGNVWCPLAFDDLTQYRRSIQRIVEVGAESIFLAHHGYFAGPHARHAPRQAATAVDIFAEEAAAILDGNGQDLPGAARAFSLRFREVSAPFVPPSLHEASMKRILELLAAEKALDRARVV